MLLLKKIFLASLVFIAIGAPVARGDETIAREQWHLVLRSVDEPSRNWKALVQSGSQIHIEFIHSWDLIPIKETLMITQQGDFLLKETQFSELAVGYDTPPVSGNYRLENGMVHITDMNVTLKTIRLRVGTVARHRLCVNDSCLELAEIFGKGRSINIDLLPPDYETTP